MNTNSRGARADVLAFYQELPFNYRASASDHAETIRRKNPLNAYPPLVAALAAKPRVIDVGCGAGWIVNSIAYHHKCDVTGIDFNPVAIERARAVAKQLKVNSHFEVADLFTYQPAQRADVVTSVGVLHHTDSCLAGIKHLADMVLAPQGRLLIGLYHTYGRRPFLDHFAKLRASGASEEALYAEFASLARGSGTWDRDETYLRSWFRDQVMHPHETCHTLQELVPLFDELGLKLESTSINRFAPLPDLQDLIASEKELESAGLRALTERRYFPGFFVVMARLSRTLA